MVHHLAKVLFLCYAVLPISAIAEEKRPNVIVIMADDIGYECLSCNGSQMYETPHLDALAASGVRFINAHSQPICTPSRVQIMTGLHNNRNYIQFGLLDPEARTFAHSMKAAGYDTCIAGKWQLMGGLEAPQHFGFDRYCLWQLNRRPSRYPNPGLEIDGVAQDFKNGEFGPDLVSDYICDFITEKKDSEKPFFIYYPMIAPHWPFVPTPDGEDWDPAMWRDAKGEPGGYKDQKYWDGMVRYTDKMVGKIVNTLDNLSLRENTLVIFTGDNGTYTGVTSQFEGKEYIGGKGSTRDAGTHVPFIASWPALARGGQVSSELVDFTDIFPTVTEIGQAETPQNLEGVSLISHLKDGSKRAKPYIYCWYSRDGNREKASQHVRTARYKLYQKGNFYDTHKDPQEKNDLSQSVPEEALEPYNTLTSALAKHLEITKLADPVQNAKRNELKKKKNKKTPKETKKKEAPQQKNDA